MISDALRLIRQYHNLNQTQLASKIAISVSYMSEIESGKKEPSIELLQKYASYFNVPLSSLIVFSETLDGSQSKSKVRAFISKKMLKILDWLNDTQLEDDKPASVSS